MYYICQKSVIISILFIVVHGSFILPEEIKTQEPPVCKASASLCGLDYRYVTDDDVAIQILHSTNQICKCPDGDVCAIGYDWSNMTNSMVQRMLTGIGNELLVKISYCRLPEVQDRCTFEQSVLVTKGRGHFTFDIDGGLKCKCRRPLVPKFSWTQEEYDYIQYGCGQRRCAQENTATCAEVSVVDYNLKTKYFCRCRQDQICTGDLPKAGEAVAHTCRNLN